MNRAVASSAARRTTRAVSRPSLLGRRHRATGEHVLHRVRQPGVTGAAVRQPGVNGAGSNNRGYWSRVQQPGKQLKASNLWVDKVVWTQATQKLYQTCGVIEEEKLVRQMQKIETGHGDQTYGEAWRTVNEITGRKRAKEGQIHNPNKMLCDSAG